MPHAPEDVDLAVAATPWADRVTLLPATLGSQYLLAALIRPDGVVARADIPGGAGAGQSSRCDRLRAALAHWFGRS